MLTQMEDEAYQNGAGEDSIEVDLQSIIEDTTRRSVVLFASLTGDAEVPTSPKLSNLPSLNRAGSGGRRKVTSPVGAELKFTKESKLGDILRNKTRNGTTNGTNKESDRLSNSGFFSLKKEEKTAKTTDNGLRSPPPDVSVSLSNRERLREREKEKIKEREREREKERERENKDLKEKEERNGKKQEKDGASGSGEMTSRDLEREKLRQREREKRKGR